MYHFNKQLVLYYIVALCLYLLVNISIANARIIVVIYGGDTCITAQQACSIAIAEALLIESEEYLSHKFSEPRREAIKKYFSMVSPGLVLNTTELEPTSLEDGRIKGIFDVPIRKTALYRLLRELGLSYTTSFTQPYVLSMFNVPDEIALFDKLFLLEQVTGVVQSEKVDNTSHKIELQLSFEDGIWVAKLLGAAQPIQASGYSIDNIWREIWGAFFSQLQKETSSHLQSYLLRVSGWKHAVEVEALGKTLSHWESITKNVLLHEVSISKGVIAAQWTLTILNMDGFEKQIKQYSLARKLHYEIKPFEAIIKDNSIDIQCIGN